MNGLLALLQVSFVTIAVGAADAGRFFRVITAAWLLASVLKFGVDGILPRAVAEMTPAAARTPSVRRQLGSGLALMVLALPVSVAVLHVPFTVPVLAALLVMATTWSATMVCAGLLKAHSRVALSGLVANVLWPLGLALAPLAVLVGGGNWETLSVYSAGLSAGALLVVGTLTARAVGTREVLALLAGPDRSLPMDADAMGAAVLSTLYEALVWMPVLLAAVIDTPPVATAAIFTAARVAGIFSWGYQAVVAVLTPKLAGTLAQRDLVATRSLLVRGAVLGAGLTVPVAAVGAIGSSEIMRAFGAAYGPFASTLSILILSRTFDAMAGPVGEALLVGRRTWLDTRLLLLAMAAGLVACLATENVLGSTAPAVGAGTTFVVANTARLVAVRRLLTRGWPTVSTAWRPIWSVAAWPGWILIAAGIAGAVALRTAAGAQATFIYLAAGSAAVGAAGILWVSFTARGVGSTLLSPLSVIAALLLTEFTLRPIGLVVDPRSAANGLLWIGFSWKDVARSDALGAGGLELLGVGFMLAWRVARARPDRRPREEPRAAPRRLAAIALTVLGGCALWLLLFFRLGGPSALTTHLAQLHLGQFGGGYGVFGMMLCLGAVVVGSWRWSREHSPAYARFTVGALAAGLLAAICLATRGPLIATVVAAGVVVLRHRKPPIHHVVVAAAIVVLAVGGLILMRAVRDYNQVESLPAAVNTAAHTPVLVLASSELQEFDHLVALDKIVPADLGWLNGQSVVDIPAQFVPRSLWPGKPLPVDFILSRALYGPGTEAGTPFTLSGEAYWNYGYPLCLALMFMLGLSGGLVWRWLLRHHSALASVSSALLVGYSYLLLTRPLAAMLLMTAMAVGAAAVCCTAAGVWHPLSDARRVNRRLWATGKTIALRAPPLHARPARGTD
jgi:hypothetical protein